MLDGIANACAFIQRLERADNVTATPTGATCAGSTAQPAISAQAADVVRRVLERTADAAKATPTASPDTAAHALTVPLPALWA
ncbi:MAG: hypothetical protein V7607_1865 [Solirubrobacteraceae bacterium]